MPDGQGVAVERGDGDHLLLAVTVEVDHAHVARRLDDEAVNLPVPTVGCGRHVAEGTGSSSHERVAAVGGGVEAVVLKLAVRDARQLELVVLVKVLEVLGELRRVYGTRGLPVVLELAAGGLDRAGDEPLLPVGTLEHAKAVHVGKVAQNLALPGAVALARVRHDLRVVATEVRREELVRAHELVGASGGLHDRHDAAGAVTDVLPLGAVEREATDGTVLLGRDDKALLARRLDHADGIALDHIGSKHLLLVPHL